MSMSSKNSILDLNQLKTVDTLYKREQETTDFHTGEVVSSQKNTLTREKQRERFIKVFIDNLVYIVDDLDKIEKNVLWQILQEMNFYNIVRIDSSFRKSIQVGSNISQGTSSKVINSLISKKVLLKVTEETCAEYKILHFTGKEYLVNPQLVGQGSFKELSKMRRTITTSFDFDKLEATKEVLTETTYGGLEEFANNIDNYELKGVEHIESKDKKHLETNIVVGNKNNEIIEAEVEPQAEKQPKLEIADNSKLGFLETNSETEKLKAMMLQIELIKEQNRQIELRIKEKIELRIKEKKEDIRQRELELKEKELKDRENSLF